MYMAFLVVGPVFPTGVGVDPIGPAEEQKTHCFPHGRGGGSTQEVIGRHSNLGFPTSIGVDLGGRQNAQTEN